MVEGLGVIVGENPLPAYLAVLTHRPAKVEILHTAASRAPACRVQRAVDALGTATTDLAEMDGLDFAAAREWGARLHERDGWHLDYTGGSKLMSAGAVAGFPTVARRSYVRTAGRRATTYIDDGSQRSVDSAGADELNLDVLAKLHGLTKLARRIVPGTPKDQLPDRRIAWQAFASWREHTDQWDLRPLNDIRERTEPRGNQLPRLPDAYCREAADEIQRFMARQHLRWPDWLKQSDNVPHAGLLYAWSALLTGGFLEAVVADVLVRFGIDPGQVRVGARAKRDNLRSSLSPEVDVMGLAGVRPYLVSCTMGSKLTDGLEKAAEAVVRGRQIGGSHTAVALVTNLSDANVSTVEDETSALLPGSPAPRIFGRKDLNSWEPKGVTTLARWATAP